jgi:glycosyltransferase involved in cell wall biosynthesis
VNSHHTKNLVRDVYGIDAEVLHPPCGIDSDGPCESVPSIAPGFFLCVARLLPYKHVDAVISAFDFLPRERLVVVGSGPEEARLRSLAGPNVTMLAALPDAALRWVYARARAVVAAAYEDFGLTPIEAATFGTPTVALRFGGYLDTVVEGVTGIFSDSPTASSIAAALRTVADMGLDSERILQHAREFSEDRFQARLRELVLEAGSPE